jgi:GDPmannose 4,6-dehydratase
LIKAIIFGAKGQDGLYLSGLLGRQGVDVVAVSRTSEREQGSVADYDYVEGLITHHAPNYIFHFAANSSTHHDTLFENHGAISTGSLNILEVVRLHCPACKVFLSGSALQFINLGLPISEKTPFDGGSPYSIARIQSVYAARYYRDKFNIAAYVGYLFNHDSPLRTEKHINQKIIQTVLRILKGSDEKLVLGDIYAQKEFNYASDIVQAIWTLVNQNEVYEAVIGSGVAHSIKDWVEYSFGKYGLDWREHVVSNPSFRPDYQILVSDPAIIKGLGWRPTVKLNELADIMLEGA